MNVLAGHTFVPMIVTYKQQTKIHTCVIEKGPPVRKPTSSVGFAAARATVAPSLQNRLSTKPTVAICLQSATLVRIGLTNGSEIQNFTFPYHQRPEMCYDIYHGPIVSTSAGLIMPKSFKAPALKTVRRFHFSDQLKRMSVIASYTVPGFTDPHCLALVKGAPEVLRDMFEEVPPHYDECYQKLAFSGARVIALGARELGTMTPQELRDPKREEFESRLKFAGFLVIHCPLKEDTQAMIHEIIESSHKVTMITGDNPLTACHIADRVLNYAIGDTYVHNQLN